MSKCGTNVLLDTQETFMKNASISTASNRSELTKAGNVTRTLWLNNTGINIYSRTKKPKNNYRSCTQNKKSIMCIQAR